MFGLYPRENESKVIDYLEDTCANWEEIAKSLMAYMSDDDVRDWAEYNGYEDIFYVKPEIRYYVEGIGYDGNDHVTDYTRECGDFDTEEEAQDKFDEVVREAEDNLDEFFLETEPNVSYWKIILEKCEETEEWIECVDVLDEYDIYKEEESD